jgi:hypothetical protein
MSSSDKRKHKTLSPKAVDRSEKLINLAEEYGVGPATIYDIRKNREEIECSLETLEETFLKEAFRNKRQKTTDAFFFCKNAVK